VLREDLLRCMMVLDCVGAKLPAARGGLRREPSGGLGGGTYTQPDDASPTTFCMLRALLMHRTAVKHGFPRFPRRFFQVLDFK
jgi:hypothetical protein